MPWANGLGITAEICASPAAPEPWVWRLSIASVLEDGPFSLLPGVERHIMVVDGAGMGLTVGRGPERRLEFAAPPMSFSGDAVTTCRLLDGPVSDLNLMVRRSHGAGALLIEHMRAGRRFTETDLAGSLPHVAAVVVMSGEVRVGSAELSPFDALLLEPGEQMPDVVGLTNSVIVLATLTEFSLP